MNLLIPYVRIPGHNDPCFDEFTYGDVNQRGKKMMQKLGHGDRIFFHTTLKGQKCITAYYVVDRVMPTKDAVKLPEILAKFKNVHLERYQSYKRVPWKNDTLVFGDPVTSRVLEKPLPFNKRLASRLSLAIRFPKGRLESQAIGAATRSWRPLSEKDVRVIFGEIARSRQAAEREAGHKIDEIWSTDEVTQVVERHVEHLIQKNPRLIGLSITRVKRQVETDEGRIDLLMETRRGPTIVVEVKLHRIGREAVKQLKGYMNWVRGGRRGKHVRGIIVCEGVLPAYADEVARLKDIRVLCYGWRLGLVPWR